MEERVSMQIASKVRGWCQEIVMEVSRKRGWLYCLMLRAINKRTKLNDMHIKNLEKERERKISKLNPHLS